jgi:D-tyrosyl-tRNA(Tyr) deacylase
MRVVIQRVSSSVQVSESTSPHLVQAAVGRGLVVLAAFEEKDSPLLIEQMAQKIKSLRIFADANGKMNLGRLRSRGAVPGDVPIHAVRRR